MSNSQHARQTTPSGRKRWPIILGVIAVLAVVVFGLGLYAYSQLSSARDDLNRASTDAAELKDALSAGDQAKANGEIKQLQANVRSAQSSLNSSILSLSAKTPFLGKNVKAVRTITDAVGSVAEDGLPPLVAVADKFNAKTFNPQGGTINVDALADLTPSLTQSSAAIREANKRIQSVDASTLLSQLQGPVTDAQEKIGDAAAIAERATVASRVVPKMLDGKHTYLLIFQNNAEIRATGGLPGAYAQLDVDNGSIKLGAQGTGGSLSELAPAAKLSKEENELFTDLLVTDFRDVNFTPDFPRAAQIAAAIVKQEKDLDVDGVVSLDPVTLSYMLKGIGPVELADGTRLTADNAVDVLLNNVYVNYPDPNEQDAFFASATERIFDKVLSGAGDPTALLKALTTATNEQRVAVWSKDADVSKEIAGTPLAHELPTGTDAGPAMGFYLNDATGAKMQYYLKSAVTGKSTKCSADGTQSYTTEMSVTSTAPADSASLPESIKGPGFGAVPGSMLMNLYLYGPTGGSIDSVSFDGEKNEFYTDLTHEGRPVALITVQVNPGQTVKVGAKVTSGKGQKGSTVVSTTPSIVPGPSVQTWKSSC
ncbi:DUF4012 domain-containing protein [Aeromicrobium wangtongii]|uniref:DUF4012 domain-containing protein n=1 Tax=Aeromicrobium wangtongii TaxID=2969247 RepID=UPI002017CC06|nr:DUF4012 domain-containing protein [Aeromicrobium wangtongii]MCL3817231.1 DUF4012 domain-containing protein [Aeromicrobium wangtongii]